MMITITPTQPFHFAHSLNFLRMFKPMSGEHVIANGSLTKALMLNGQAIWVTVRADGNQMIVNHAEAATVSATQIGERVRFWLSLDDDLSAFYALAQDDAVFAPIVKSLYGYHQVKFTTPFENAIWAILSARNPIPMAQRMKRALMEAFGKSITVDGVTHWDFPEPQQMLHSDETELNRIIGNMAMGAQKSRYMMSAVRHFANIDEHWLRSGDYDAVEAWLRTINGIGPWSANFIMLRGLGRMDRVPLAEKAILTSLSRVYNQGKAMPPDAVRALGERYGVWQGYWAHYLRVGG